MNAKEAREIVKRGVIPGDIDSIDLAKAEGYLAALEGPEVGRLVDALGKISTTNGLQYSDIFRIRVCRSHRQHSRTSTFT